MLDFISKDQAKNKNQTKLPNKWTKQEKKQFLIDLKSFEFSDESMQIISDRLNLKREVPSAFYVKNYLSFVLSLKEKEQKMALMNLDQLGKKEINSKYVNNFLKHEEKIKAKFESKKITELSAQNRYRELFYGCKAFRPNEINKGAAREFKRFNLALNLGTLGVSYAYYNMDKKIDGEWFEKLGYDIGTSLLFSYVGGIIQTNAADTQIVKTLKNYFIGRVIGVTDVLLYDPIFSHEREIALKHIEDLKKDPSYKKEIDDLLISYRERGLFRKYKEEVIKVLKELPFEIGLGIKGNTVDENNIDWNNLSHSDLDRPEVQDVMVAAAMAQVYQQTKGEWIDTSDAGLDRYVFNSLFYGVQIPRSIVQNYITYQMLCMGQDNSKISFAKAALFNVTSNFIVNQALYGYRQKAIGN
jgi:hypothetical protein